MPSRYVPRTCAEEDCDVVMPRVRGGGFARCPPHQAARSKALRDEYNHAVIERRRRARLEPRCVECGGPVEWKNRMARPPRRCPEHRDAHRLTVHRDAKRARAVMRLQKRVTDVVVCGEDGCTTPVKWTFTRYQEFCTVHREQRKRAQYQARQAAQVVRHAAERGYVPCPRCGTHYPPIRTWVPVRPCPDCRKEIHREKAVIHFRERAPEARHASELRWRRANADKVRHRNYARRAAVTGAEAEYIELGSVAVRDNFYCGICGNPVDMTLVWPHPDSPTLDHIVPVSHGGPHIYANVRLAHSTCNSARSNRGTY